MCAISSPISRAGLNSTYVDPSSVPAVWPGGRWYRSPARSVSSRPSA
jgi:hypothetical protein